MIKRLLLLRSCNNKIKPNFDAPDKQADSDEEDDSKKSNSVSSTPTSKSPIVFISSNDYGKSILKTTNDRTTGVSS